MVCAIDANIPVRALDHMGIGTDLSRNEPVGTNGTHPAGKLFGVDHLRVEPPAHLSDLVFPRLQMHIWWSRDHGSLHFSNNTRLVAADRNGGRHTECRLATALLSNGQLPAPPLRSAKSRRVMSQNEDSRDHVLSNFGANEPCLPSTPQRR